MSIIVEVDHGSPAHKAGLQPGEALLSINGEAIRDVLDYKFYSYDARLELEVQSPERAVRRVKIRKGEGQDLGLSFESYLMDKQRHCANRCVFCFVDQMPKGLRESLYFKDDDARLSFLLGNYITMTNLSEQEVRRMIDLRISPINISVQTTDPRLRVKMLNNPRAGECLSYLKLFADAGIRMNCQLVICPGWNDRESLDRSMADLAALHPAVDSVSVVPVGITRYREGLAPMTPVDQEKALEIIGQVDAFGTRCLERFGSRLFYCADELYLKAGLPLPEDEYYEEYPQLENGVGMLRLFRQEFCAGLSQLDGSERGLKCSIATGVAAAPFLKTLVDLAAENCHTVECEVFPITNRFFGETVDVAGLVTGGDLMEQLRGRDLGEKLLIPATMLRHGGEVFLDDVSLGQVEAALGIPVQPVEQDGWALLEALLQE